jgi:hypothetical protein
MDKGETNWIFLSLFLAKTVKTQDRNVSNNEETAIPTYKSYEQL